jgi:hypothetical protein
MPSELAISIDFKHNRIRIHKATLHAMGSPEYIHFLVNPEQRAFAIARSDKTDLSAHPLHWSRLTGGHSFELHSKSLVKSLLGLCESWQNNRTYRICGKIVPKGGAAVFHVAEAIMV